MKLAKHVQIIITHDAEGRNESEGEIIFDVYRSVDRAIVFLKELGINLRPQSLYHLWKKADTNRNALSFGIDSSYEQKLMQLCPVNKRVSLNTALDNASAHIGILPMMD